MFAPLSFYMCPLCACPNHRISWLREVRYQDHSFEYVECWKCRSLFCLSMPGAEMLMKMYGPEYATNASTGDSVDPKNPGAVIASLSESGTGTFVDFGCGERNLLVAAREAGWRCFGVELNPDTAKRTEAKTAIPVYTELSSVPQGFADALHLGDVLKCFGDVRVFADKTSAVGFSSNSTCVIGRRTSKLTS